MGNEIEGTELKEKWELGKSNVDEVGVTQLPHESESGGERTPGASGIAVPSN
jgi:hypothetical protein